MADRIVRYILAGDSRGAVRAMKETETAAGKTGRKLDRTGKEAKRSFEVTEAASGKLHHGIKFLAGATGIGSVVFGVHEAISAGQEWQQQQAQLQNALQATGAGGAAQMRQLNEEIDRSTTHGGFLPAEQAQGLSTFVRLTHSATKAISLNQEAVNFARGAHVDYATAVQRVAQIQTGNVGRLQRYLGLIQPVTYYVDSLTAAQKKQNPELLKHAQMLDRQATAAKANQIVQQKFGGATAAYAHTAAGAVSNAQHAFALLSEQIGKILLPYVTRLAEWLTRVAENVQHNWPAISAQVREVTGWFKRHKDIVIAVAAALGTLVIGVKAVIAATKAWAVIQKLLDIELMGNPIGLIVLAIAALTGAVIYCYLHFKTFRDIVNGVFRWLVGAVKTVVAFVRDHWKLLAIGLSGPLAPILLIVTHLKTIKRLVGDIIHGGAVHAVGHFLSHPFGLHKGGIVPMAFAPGGVVPGTGNRDTVPAWLTPGESVLTREATRALGPQTIHALNAGGRAGIGDITIEPGAVVLKIGARTLAEAMVHYQLKMGARA